MASQGELFVFDVIIMYVAYFSNLVDACKTTLV
jgi:hypothetical protein